MGRLFCLFVCYGVQESRGAMDGGGRSCIEDGLAEGTAGGSIRGSMRKEEGEVFLVVVFVDYLVGC